MDQKKTIKISIQIECDLYDKLKIEAKKNTRSVSSQIVHYAKSAILKEEKK